MLHFSVTDLPPPLRRADLAARLIEEHKYERIRELEEAKAAELAKQLKGDDDMDMEMEVHYSYFCLFVVS